MKFTAEMTNFCKGVAVLLLLAHHLIPFHGGGSSFVGQFGQIGKICVAMFVFLSGLGLMRADASSGFRACVNKTFFRLVRLYVNFWIVAFLFLLVLTCFFNRGLDHVYPNGWFPSFVFELLGLKSTCAFNPTWWFFSAIIPLYLLYPLLRWCVTKSWWWMPVVVAVGFLFIHIRPGVWLLPFVLGMVAARFNLVECLAKRWMLALMAATVCAGAILRMSTNIGLRLDGVIACGLIVVLFGTATGMNGRWLAGCVKGLTFVGFHSMNVFLLHTFILKNMWPSFFKAQPLAIGFLALLGLSMLFSMLIESLKRGARINDMIKYAGQHFEGEKRS